jgi:multidrug efflux pump subunit AcrA (membrane-fusion protein)
MRRRLWWVGGAVVVLVGAVVVTVGLTRPDGRAAAGTGTAKVQRGTVTSTVSAAGTVAALQSRSLGLTVPSTAVVDGTVTVRVGGRTEKRAVEVGLRGDVSTEIRTGLDEGDEVMVSGG